MAERGHAAEHHPRALAQHPRGPAARRLVVHERGVRAQPLLGPTARRAAVLLRVDVASHRPDLPGETRGAVRDILRAQVPHALWRSAGPVQYTLWQAAPFV